MLGDVIRHAGQLRHQISGGQCNESGMRADIKQELAKELGREVMRQCRGYPAGLRAISR